MLNNLLPQVEDVPVDPVIKPTRRSLAALPDLDPLPPELTARDIERTKAVSEHSGFGQSHAPSAATRGPAKPAPAPVEPVALDTGRMMRRSKQTALLSTRVQPETLRFIREFANGSDVTFSNAVELMVQEFRKGRGL